MADQGLLDFERRYPNPADLEHIVGPATVSVHPVRTPRVFVAGARPLAQERAARFLALIPVASRGQFTLYQKLPYLIVADVLRVFINQPEFKAIYGHAGCTVLDGIRKVCQKKSPSGWNETPFTMSRPNRCFQAAPIWDGNGATSRKTKSQPVGHIFRLAFGIGKNCGIERRGTAEKLWLLIGHVRNTVCGVGRSG